jgi:hypothetical protein
LTLSPCLPRRKPLSRGWSAWRLPGSMSGGSSGRSEPAFGVGPFGRTLAGLGERSEAVSVALRTVARDGRATRPGWAGRRSGWAGRRSGWAGPAGCGQNPIARYSGLGRIVSGHRTAGTNGLSRLPRRPCKLGVRAGLDIVCRATPPRDRLARRTPSGHGGGCSSKPNLRKSSNVRGRSVSAKRARMSPT